MRVFHILTCQNTVTSFGWFPSVWILCMVVLEHSVYSINTSIVSRKNNHWQPPEAIVWSLPSHESPSSLQHRVVSPSHTYYRPPLGVFAGHSLFLYSDMLQSSPLSFRLAQAILSWTFLCINTATIASRLFILLTPPMKTEQAECSKMSAHKIQAPGNRPKERM